MYSFKDKIFIYCDGGIYFFLYFDLIKLFWVIDNFSGVDWIYVDCQGDFYVFVFGYGIVKIMEDGGCIDIMVDVLVGIVFWIYEEYYFIGFKSYVYFLLIVEDYEYYQLFCD